MRVSPSLAYKRLSLGASLHISLSTQLTSIPSQRVPTLNDLRLQQGLSDEPFVFYQAYSVAVHPKYRMNRNWPGWQGYHVSPHSTLNPQGTVLAIAFSLCSLAKLVAKHQLFESLLMPVIDKVPRTHG